MNTQIHTHTHTHTHTQTQTHRHEPTYTHTHTRTHTHILTYRSLLKHLFLLLLLHVSGMQFGRGNYICVRVWNNFFRFFFLPKEAIFLLVGARSSPPTPTL